MIRLAQMPDKSSDYWAIKTATVMRRGYFQRRELLLLRDSPHHTQAPETGAPFSARPRADVETLEDGAELVKRGEYCPPSSAPGSPFIIPAQETQTMAAQLDHLFSYGPLDVVATSEGKAQGLHVLHEDAQMSAFISSDDPAHKEILALIEKNPHSRGFVANQIQARLEQEGRWVGPSLEEEGVTFGPSQEVAREEPASERAPEVSLEKAPPAVGPVMPMKAGVSAVKAQEQPEPENEPVKDQGLSTGSPKSEEKAAQSSDLPVPDPLDAQQPETSPKVAEPAKEEDLTKDWPGSPATDAQATRQKTPEPEPASVFPKKSPPEVLLADPKRGKALVLDHGDKVSVTNRALLGIGREAEERRNKSVEVALKAAKERFGEPVRFSGSRAFEEKTIEMAVRLGIQLEPATEHGKRAYEKALEARSALGPSQIRAPARQKTVEKGIGL